MAELADAQCGGRGRGEDGEGAGAGALEVVIRGGYLTGRGLHDGDVVRVLPDTAHRARPGDLVAAAAPDGAVAVGVLALPPADGAPCLLGDWDGPPVRFVCLPAPTVLGTCAPVALRLPGNRYRRQLRPLPPLATPEETRIRVPLPFHREAAARPPEFSRWRVPPCGGPGSALTAAALLLLAGLFWEAQTGAQSVLLLMGLG